MSPVIITPRRLQWVGAFLTALCGAVVLYAQNPVSITQVGVTPITTTVPVSGTVTATQGTGSNLHVVCDSGCSGGTQYTQDAALTVATTVGTMAMGRASAAAPTDVSADGDAVIPWYLRSGALVAQPTFAGVLWSTGNGTAGTGTPRVTIASDNTAFVVNARPQDSGGTSMTDTTAHALKTFPVDPATGTALTVPSAGNGTSDAGTTRVAIASNNTAVSGMGVGATGSAPPANAVYGGGVTSGATGGLLAGVTLCDSQGYLDMTTATTTEIAPLVASRTIQICSVVAQAGGTTTMTIKRGTGTNCGTGTASISPGFELTAQSGFTVGNGAGIVLGSAGAGTVGGATTSANAVCITNSAAVNLHVLIRYAVY